jgi:hypothetical protein
LICFVCLFVDAIAEGNEDEDAPKGLGGHWSELSESMSHITMDGGARIDPPPLVHSDSDSKSDDSDASSNNGDNGRSGHVTGRPSSRALGRGERGDDLKVPLMEKRHGAREARRNRRQQRSRDRETKQRDQYVYTPLPYNFLISAFLSNNMLLCDIIGSVMIVNARWRKRPKQVPSAPQHLVLDLYVTLAMPHSWLRSIP